MKYKLKRYYDFLRYDIPRFVKNVWIYREALWRSYPFDYEGALHYLKIHLEQLEPRIRNGYHLRGDKTADRVKTCRILLERILSDHEQYSFYHVDTDFTDEGLKWKTQPKNCLHPREGTKLYSKIVSKKEKNEWELLFKMLEKHLNSFWD